MAEPVDQQTRYRVTGSLFLLALAIICLPMLFDGEGVANLELESLPAPSPPVAVQRLDSVAPESDFIERVDELRDSVDEQGYDRDTGTRIGQPVLAESGTAESVWAVQVAAFAVDENARNLREELRAAGFEAFISTHRSDAGIRSRVAVGPIAERTDAEALRDRIADRFDLAPRVVAFSN